ncbi:cytochrome P450 [Colletotrichum godetiae]|uniref:Cytochrome P450 n=1 Tax=Colletotrichum godetiae TaxID=1209918 RepID=A0AAJ0AJG7_9PEZI|nr:cytochrome P450 [Colletotrichum godetiae]KAK1673573.1 cytochrome P450 [Colletotrichum godetiae]
MGSSTTDAISALSPSHFVNAATFNPVAFLLCTILTTAAAFHLYTKTTRRTYGLPLPPQPPSKPILGHLTDLVSENKARRWHLKLEGWAREYGAIFGVRTGFIVDYYVNSDVLVKELFDKKSAVTADRPVWIMSNEILNNGFNTLFLDASDPIWKNQKKVIQQLLASPQQAGKIVPFLEYETMRFLRDNVVEPAGGLSGARLSRGIERYTYSAFAMVIMGMDVPNDDDSVIDFLQAVDTFPGANIIDLVPSLGKLPLFLKPWEKSGRARYRRDLAWGMKRVKTVEDAMARGDSSFEETFLGSALADEKLKGMTCKEELAILSFALIVASADTSRMTTWSFVEAMMQFPEAQARAQEQIDKVVGDRPPVYEDYACIPYIRMLLKEVWRWRPPVALGHPHITSREVEVGGYRLPKGARIHLNAYAISRDPARHEDPDRFWPERFEHDETSTMESINAQDPTKRDHFAFGAGRRVCPGYTVAERSAAVTMMRILWAFKILPAEGAETPLEFADYADSLPGNPGKNMPVRFLCRSEKRKRVILKAFEEMEGGREKKVSFLDACYGVSWWVGAG